MFIRISRTFGPLVAGSFLLVLCAASARAQVDAGTALIDSPVKLEPSATLAGESVVCSIPLVQAQASLFGVDTIDPDASPVEFVSSELQSPFRVFRTDESCAFISSWTTGVPGSVVTTTGIAVSNTTDTYWVVHTNTPPFLAEYILGTGVPTGQNCPLPVGAPAMWGPAVIDSNETARELLYVENVVTDQVMGIDLSSCSMICNFGNPDNQGGGAFGNGLGDAAFPQECRRAELVISSGRPAEGQVSRIGQIDCEGNYCPDRWDLRGISTFINGIDEFRPSGAAFAGPATDAVRYIVLIDNLTGEKKIVCRPFGITDCQGRDPGTLVLFVNGSLGGATYTVPVDPTTSISTAFQRVSGSNGKFVYHFNAGVPDSSTLTQTLDLGPACFPFLDGSPSIVENNLGKTNLVGPTNYFGTVQTDPSPAPVFIEPNQVVIDATNLPSGSKWTAQAVAVNPATTSQIKPVSLTNAIIVDIR